MPAPPQAAGALRLPTRALEQIIVRLIGGIPCAVGLPAGRATPLHLAFEQAYAEANTLDAYAVACWRDGDRAGYTRVIQEHACLFARLDDLGALYWAANHPARDLTDHLEEQGNAGSYKRPVCCVCEVWKDER